MGVHQWLKNLSDHLSSPCLSNKLLKVALLLPELSVVVPFLLFLTLSRQQFVRFLSPSLTLDGARAEKAGLGGLL